MHPTQKPVGILRELVRCAPPGGLVLDPFAGSGATGEAALLEGRRFAGCELEPVFVETSRARLAALGEQGNLFEVADQAGLFEEEGAA